MRRGVSSRLVNQPGVCVLHVDVMTLPCNRGRHGSCAGAVSLGIAKRRTRCECLCTCHSEDATLALYAQLSPA